MLFSRREALILAGAGLAAALGSWFLAPILRRRQSVASALHAAIFSDLAGERRTLSDWQGKVLVCNFWATWCAPCRREVPMLIKLWTEFRALGIEVVGIAVDSAANVVEFSRTIGIEYPVLFARQDVETLMRQAGDPEGALPYTVVLDRKGAAAYWKLGVLDGPTLRTKIRALL